MRGNRHSSRLRIGLVKSGQFEQKQRAAQFQKLAAHFEIRKDDDHES